MSSTITLDEVKTLLRYSTDLKPEARDESLVVPPAHPEPYELRPGRVDGEIRAIVKDGTMMVVKFGLGVYSREAEAMSYVASRTSVPVPRVYAVFTESFGGSTMTYIVQEYIPGMRLEHAFESLTAADRDAIARQLKDIFTQLRGLTGDHTRLEPFGCGSWARTLWFKCFQRKFPIADDGGRTTRSLLTYFQGITNDYSPAGNWTLDEFLSFFDLDRAPIFSHGDLTPWNIMVHNGRISGIVDWAEAGWYPYFWDSFVLDRAALRFRGIEGAEEMLRAALLEFFPEGAKFEIHWDVQCRFWW